jgi:hypothetical protein
VSCHSFKIEAVVSPNPGEPDGIRQMLTVVFSPNGASRLLANISMFTVGLLMLMFSGHWSIVPA